MIIPTKQRDQYLSRAEDHLIKEQNTNELWDPASKIPSIKQLIEENKKTKAQQLYLEDNIEKIKQKETIKTIKTATIIILSLILFFSFPHIPLMQLSLPIAILIIIFFSRAYKIPNIKKVKKDIIKLEVAKRNNYLYSPDESIKRYIDYTAAYPEAFQRGDHSQNIEDVFWGKVKRHNQEYKFTTGVFNYKQIEGSGRHRRTVTYLDHYFAININKKINTRFTLTPNKNLLRKFLTRNKIATESKEFNDTFKISIRNKKEDSELEVTRILTPRVQEELLKLNEHAKPKKTIFQKTQNANGTTIIMDKDTILFYIPGPLMKDTKTKFKKNMKIQEEDLQSINQELNTLIEISSEIAKYIN